MSDQPTEDQVPGGNLSGNEDGASSDGDSGPGGADADGRGGAPAEGEAKPG
ncbi:hypothetical protein P0Y31_12730 [Knoellia sp. 3-2P3]|uniref:hypothetical protein n=1 Tax=unclassified Knoellia TaxID=2618719 RepID=UPI0023DA4CEE|nr:hypothetical protein [Knoellia sp. 3-2P3]MDF2093211.1 hypothetical protein [Knoellia sp. 3-2P3]